MCIIKRVKYGKLRRNKNKKVCNRIEITSRDRGNIAQFCWVNRTECSWTWPGVCVSIIFCVLCHSWERRSCICHRPYSEGRSAHSVCLFHLSKILGCSLAEKRKKRSTFQKTNKSIHSAERTISHVRIVKMLNQPSD